MPYHLEPLPIKQAPQSESEYFIARQCFDCDGKGIFLTEEKRIIQCKTCGGEGFLSTEKITID